ncbi:hypothetical protein FWH30_01550 [Microgenomates group bacterium]|nr:hypothetical protein [Microgenomates group bacterium]
MKNNNTIEITDSQLAINFVFYNLLKKFIKLSQNQLEDYLESIERNKNESYDKQLALLDDSLGEKLREKLRENDTDIFEAFANNKDFIDLIEFSLYLLLQKDWLLKRAKTIAIEKFVNDGSKLCKLTMAYDTLSIGKPYYTRVTGALLTLKWFEDLTALCREKDDLLKRIVTIHKKLNKNGLESNQIFLLLFTESMNQSITAASGSDFEKRITETLVNCGVKENTISQGHDSKYADMEYDHKFVWNNKTIGIGAKRTLRERYKQFARSPKDLDVDILINVTLGVDFNEQKLENISRYGVYSVVADEVYNKHKYFQNNDFVIKGSDFNKDFLDKITK